MVSARYLFYGVAAITIFSLYAPDICLDSYMGLGAFAAGRYAVCIYSETRMAVRD
mgnify:CR=1 FL=1|jgi:hypothetical protein